MASVTVEQLAAKVGISSEQLLDQFKQAGVNDVTVVGQQIRRTTEYYYVI